MIEGLEIPSLLLDPQNEDEVITQAYERIRSASQGQITDFNPSSPVAALIEGQAYVYMELLWYLNMLPEALALEVLRLSGVSRNPGTKARGSINFMLQSALATDFVVQPGFVIGYKDSGFITVATLVIPAGAIEASAPVEAIREGYDLNVPAYGIANATVGLSYVQTVYNPYPITGGSDVEPLAETIKRAQRALRSRDVLVTVEDYQLKSQDLLGFGSTATAIPLLSSDKETEKVGNLHVFLADTEGNPPSVETCQSIQGELRKLSFAGASVWVSPYEFRDIQLDITVKVAQLSQDLADQVYQDLKQYFSPASFELGSSIRIREVEFRVRSIEGINEIVSLLIERQAVNLPMFNKHTQPRIDTLALTMVDLTGFSYTYYFGIG